MHAFSRFTVAAALLLNGLCANAQDSLGGFPDLSLDGAGFFNGPYRGENERLSSSAENADGMMVTVGTFGSSDSRCVLVRHHNSHFTGAPELALDAVTDEFCTKILVLGNGEFRVIGSGTEVASGRFTGFIVALNANGSVNTTTHPQGLQTINAMIPWLASTERTLLYSGVVDAQGRVLALGRVIDSATNTTRGLILRFLADGTLDTSFGVQGSLPLADYNPPIVTPSSVATDSNGRVYVMGTTTNPGFPDVGVIFRLLEDGQMDLDFGAGMNAVARSGGGGRGFFGQCYRVSDLLIDTQQRMLLGCEPDPSGNTPGPVLPPGILRLQANGQPDPTFGGGDGYVELLPWNSTIGAIGRPRIALRANGQIVAGATLYRASTHIDPQDIIVTRLHASGSIDGTFGFDGFHQSHYTQELEQPSDGYNEQLYELRLDARERAVLSGAFASQSTSNQPTYGLLARLGMADPERHAGFLDPDFNYQGYRMERINEVAGPRRATNASDVTIDAQGRSVLLGNLTLETNPVGVACGISRYRPDGAHDQSFSGNGQRAISLVAGGETYCDSVVALSGGDMLVAGFHPLAGSPFYTGAVVRLLEDGTLDTNFWGNGVLDTWIDLGFSTRQISARFSDMVVDPQGRILLLAQGRAIGVQDDAFRCGFGAMNDECGILIRLLADGSLDTSFGNNGMRLLISSTNPSRLYPNTIAIDHGGRILVSGYDGSGAGDYSAVLYDIASDGLSGQSLRLRNNTSCIDSTTLVVDAGNGRVMSCYKQDGTSPILRLLPNNNIDLNFGLGGLAAVEFSFGLGASVTSIIPQSDNSLIVIGSHRHFAVWEPSFGRYDIGVMKLDRFGAPLGFGARGGDLFRFPAYTGAYEEYAVAAAMQANGRILIAGTQVDRRPGAPSQDNTVMTIQRIGNPQPQPLSDALFMNEFE